MGLYINTEHCKKEIWLAENARPILAPNIYCGSSSYVLVCLVDNGPFTAAAIIYSEEEFKRWVENDGRKKKWHIVEVEKLRDVVDSSIYNRLTNGKGKDDETFFSED